RHIPIPHAIRDRLIELLKQKIDAGVYEPSNSAYRSGWFCVVKKDGSSLRIVHDLQKLNSITIRDAGTLPSPDDFSESCAGRACIGALDQFSSYD
ncbi:DNA/RNA polymerase, partial [Exidia glandulosa HHB12029]